MRYKLKTFLSNTTFACCFLFVASLGFNLLYSFYSGFHESTDYQVAYEPIADGFLMYVQGDSALPTITSTNLFYITFPLLVAVLKYIFATSYLTVFLVLQSLLNACVTLLVFFTLLRFKCGYLISFLFSSATFLVYDFIGWTNWGTPDNLYRFLYLSFVTILFTLYDKKQFLSMFLLAIPSFTILLFSRPDTVFTFIPVWIVCLYSFFYHFSSKVKQRLGFVICAIATLFAIWFVYHGKSVSNAFSNFAMHYNTGHVIAQYYDLPAIGVDESHSFGFHLLRFSKLFLMRSFYFFNPFPPFWSTGHKFYYAIHIIPLYFLSLISIVRIIKEKNYHLLLYFIVLFSFYFLHAMTRVDAALRTLYTYYVFLIIFSGVGADYLILLIRSRKLKKKT